MKPRDKLELALIPIAAVSAGALSLLLPRQLTASEWLGLSCLAWLVQGGIRDLWLLLELKKQRSASPQRKLACMCFESTVGFTGLCVAAGFSLAGLGGRVLMSPTRVGVMAGVVFLVGFLLKDLIITWRPLGLRRDPDHHSIVFTWW